MLRMLRAFGNGECDVAGGAWLAAGASKADLHRVLRTFNANAGEFRAAAEKLDEDD